MVQTSKSVTTTTIQVTPINTAGRKSGMKKLALIKIHEKEERSGYNSRYKPERKGILEENKAEK